ncbi:unnamed protein product [Heterobilharzia americana]|nr:unnamed protein product [Heterobilharzia americana]
MKSRKVRCLRQTTELSASSDSDEDDVDDSAPSIVTDSNVVVEAIRELQKLRKRPAGIGLSALATGKEIPNLNLAISNDPFKLKTGGLVDLNSISSAKQTEEDDDVEARLAKTFATETNKRDEDAEMIKYIEEELAKRKGLIKPSSLERGEDSDLLQDVPEYLRPSIGQQKEDMLSNQMLCGIPEVDLGVEAKMKNIEATEEAKQILLKQRYRRHNHLIDEMTPMNMAVNFVQHSRWNNYTNGINNRRADVHGKRERNHTGNMEKSVNMKDNVRGRGMRCSENGTSHIQAEKSTDNIALQRFKNFMRDKKRR